MLDYKKGVFPISFIAEDLGVHQRTLRIWDEEGLLVPARSAKNRRQYSFADIEKGKLIQFMTNELGLNLIGIKIIFEMNQDVPISQLKKRLEKMADNLGVGAESREINKISHMNKGRKPKEVA